MVAFQESGLGNGVPSQSELAGRDRRWRRVLPGEPVDVYDYRMKTGQEPASSDGSRLSGREWRERLGLPTVEPRHRKGVLLGTPEPQQQSEQIRIATGTDGQLVVQQLPRLHVIKRFRG